jgi:lactoylglutathione lyase
VNQLRLHHVALWVDDLERMRDFFVTTLGGTSGPLYENPRKGFRSYFISFSDGPRIELMHQDGRNGVGGGVGGLGYAHVALSVDGRAAVDEGVALLRSRGVRVVSEPRVTGDGYYEAVLEDPEGNRIEFVE